MIHVVSNDYQCTQESEAISMRLSQNISKSDFHRLFAPTLKGEAAENQPPFRVRGRDDFQQILCFETASCFRNYLISSYVKHIVLTSNRDCFEYSL